MKHKIISLLLVFVLIFTTIGSAFAQEENESIHASLLTIEDLQKFIDSLSFEELKENPELEGTIVELKKIMEKEDDIKKIEKMLMETDAYKKLKVKHEKELN